MATKDSKTYVRKRKGMRADHDAEISLRPAAEVQSFKREKWKDSNVEDDSAKRLLSLELDVAEALVDFWRMAHEPSQQHKVVVHLRWSCKRTRSTRCNKDLVTSCKPKEEPEDVFSFAKKNRSSCTFGIDSCVSDRDEIDSLRMSKESSKCESRAQSPSSPLPSMQLSCGAFLPRGSPTAKSAFQNVLPLVSLQRPYLIPVKSEIEDIHLEAFDIRPRDVSVCRESKSFQSTMPKATVKKEPLREQIMDTGDGKCAASLEELRVKAEAYPVSDLIMLNKPKSPLSEKEKESRRFRRIQANRESARQTIRKNQVVCEELMKKVSRLASENEGMKKKRESLMQDLFSLKGQNYHLKQQLKMEAAGNVGLVSAESPLKTSEPFSVSAFRVSSLPYAGIPAHSFAWAMAAAEATATNQAYTFDHKQKNLDVNGTYFLLQHQATDLALPATPSSKEASAVRVIERKSSHTFSGVYSPASMGRSQKETGCSTMACSENCTADSEAPSCNPSATTAADDPGLTDDLPEESAGEISALANRSSSQPPSFSIYGSKAGLDATPAMAVAFENMECFLSSHNVQGVGCGYAYDGNKNGYFFHGHSRTHALMARNYLATMAAAEARRRRKELTRLKLLRSRALRLLPISVADTMKEV